MSTELPNHLPSDQPTSDSLPNQDQPTATGAAFGKLPILKLAEGPAAGGIFFLNRSAPEDATLTIDNAWTIQLCQGSPCVSARGGAATTYEDSFLQSLFAAQKGLDLLSLEGITDRATIEVENEHLVWWVESGNVVLRVHENIFVGFLRTRGNGTSTDAIGNPLPPSPRPALAWHESFRYYRLSQTTEDLYDAYRNLFLALESILSTIEPVQLRPNGRSYEPESVWLRRALMKAKGLVDIARFVPSSLPDPADHLFKDLYESKRTAFFHAKKNRNVFLPQDLAHRDAVTASLTLLANLYLALVEAHLSLRRGRTLLSEKILTALAQNYSEMAITDEEKDLLQDESINLESHRMTCLSTRWAKELDDLSTRNFLGTISPPPKTLVRQLLFYKDDQLGTIRRLREPLSLGKFAASRSN